MTLYAILSEMSTVRSTLIVKIVVTLYALTSSRIVFCLSTPRQRHFSRRDYLTKSVATTATTFLVPTISNAAILDANDDQQGISAITDSQIGRAFRRSIVQGAQVADKLDEKWERFSDSLRDKSKCDPNTGRRLYDNGKRKDGTPIGNPGLGALCNPEPLLPLDISMAESILDAAVNSALNASGGDRASSSEREVLHKSIQETKNLVRPSFERSMQTSVTDDDKKRGMFNFNLYATLRAIATFLRGDKSSIRAFQIAWGNELTAKFAPSASRKDFLSPFSGRDEEFQDFDYDMYSLLDALGKLTVTLNQLKLGGFLGYYEISIPYDDYGSVVTVALDDYASIGVEILLSEQNVVIEGPTQSVVRALFDNARINFGLDTFYIDPSTTRQIDYNPTQLLISLNGLRKM